MAGRRCRAGIGAWQIGIDLQIQLGRSLPDLAQHEVLDGTEPALRRLQAIAYRPVDRPHAQCVFDGNLQVCHLGCLQQPQDLHIPGYGLP